MRSLLLAIAALLGMSSFAEAQPPCRPIEWCASGNWLDKHCWCYRRGPQWWAANAGGTATGTGAMITMIIAAGAMAVSGAGMMTEAPSLLKP